MAKQDFVHIVTERDTDGTEVSYAHLKAAKANKHAAEYAAKLAEDEIENLEWEAGDAGLEKLREVVVALREGKHLDAYDAWREYADDAEPREDVMLQDVLLVED